MPGKSIQKARADIEHAASVAVTVIANAAAEAAKTVAAATAEATKVVSAKNNDDHDTLTTLVGAVANLDQKFTEKFADLKTDIKNLGDGTSATILDHETRIRKLEQQRWLWAGALAVVLFIAPVIFNLVEKILYPTK